MIFSDAGLFHPGPMDCFVCFLFVIVVPMALMASTGEKRK